MSKKVIVLRQYQEDIIEETLAAIEFGSDNIVIDSPPACVPGYTEFLTQNGWKRIDKYNYDDSICIVSANGRLSFEKPIKYIDEYCEENFINIKNNRINIIVSKNHTIPYILDEDIKLQNTNFKLNKIKAIDLINSDKNIYIPIADDLSILRKEITCNSLFFNLFDKNETITKEVKPEDNKHYCFETSTGFWLMRQNGNIYPTGNSGKSLLIAKTSQHLALKGKVVISITITALLDQIAEHLALIGEEYSILKAGRESEFDSTKNIQLVQAHTLHARLSTTKVDADYFLMDEVHREYRTDRTSAILDFLNPKARIGYSGTCYDQAGFALEGAEMLTTTTVQNLQDQGYLCPIKYFIPKWAEQVDFSQVKSSGNDYNNTELERIINTTEHLQLAIKSMNDMDAKNKKTLVFCSSIEQADKFTNMLNQAGYEAMSFHSKSDNSEDILHAFKHNVPFKKTNKKQKDQDTGDLFEDMPMVMNSEPEKYVRCLVSINRLGIGFDCPDVVLGVQLRPTMVRSLYIQQVMRMARMHPSKQFSEYLDLAQTTSRFGFHTDHYIPLQRTGDRAVDKKAMQDLESTYALDDINVVLDSDEPTCITRDSYVAQLEAIKKSLEKDLTSMSIQDLAKAYDLAKTHIDVITIACLIYTWKYGKPVSKSGYAYDYKPEQYWSESFFGKPDFHVLHDMQYYFDEFPSMQKQWFKSLKTRCRNIIKEELGLFRITGFIQFLRNKHVEESVSMLDEYRKPEEDNEEDYAPLNTNFKPIPFIEIDEDEVPFSLSIAIPLASILAFAQLSTNFI